MDDLLSVGTKVIVQTCYGEFRGKIAKHVWWDFESKKRDAYQVSGEGIITTVRKVIIDEGQELFRGAMCNMGSCEDPEGCLSYDKDAKYPKDIEPRPWFRASPQKEI